ncbi:MAG: hydrogenase maturation protease [Candidatus Heimdallarchaeota archaeon]
MWKNKILVLGVGNTLKGDDGLGPAFIDQFNSLIHNKYNGKIEAIDVGTGLTPFLLDVCMFPEKPSAILIVDGYTGANKKHPLKEGDIFEINSSSLETRPEIGSIESHRLPPRDFLTELREQGVKIRILVCKIHNIPNEVNMGLSDSAANAIPRICEKVERIINEML